MSGLGALSLAWIAAEAALPEGWALDGVLQAWAYDAVRGAVAELPKSDAAWVAIASHQTGTDRAPVAVIGEGEHPRQALNRLADRLRQLRGPTTG